MARKCTGCKEDINPFDPFVIPPNFLRGCDDFGYCSECSDDYGWDSDEQRAEWKQHMIDKGERLIDA